MRLHGVWWENICINMLEKEEGEEVLHGDEVLLGNKMDMMMLRKVLFDINDGYIYNRMKSISSPISEMADSQDDNVVVDTALSE